VPPAGRGAQGAEPDVALPAAVAPARAFGTGWVECHVTDLAGLAVRARQQPAADDQATTDADVAGDIHEIVDPRVQAAPELGQRGEVRVIADHHGHAGEIQGVAERRGEREVPPVQVGSGHDRVSRVVDNAGNGRDDVDDRRVLLQRTHRLADHLAAEPAQTPGRGGRAHR
jgi:hypothetical protein